MARGRGSLRVLAGLTAVAVLGLTGCGTGGGGNAPAPSGGGDAPKKAIGVSVADQKSLFYVASVQGMQADRELDVLREMATGKSNAAVARALHITERAVEKHTNALFGKIGVTEEPDVNRRVLAVLTYLQAVPPR